MATKGRNKPRVRGTKDMVKKVKNTAKKTLRSGIGMPMTAGLGMKKIKEIMDKKKKGGKKDSSSGVSKSPRPKPRPKQTSLRPKIRPKKKG